MNTLKQRLYDLEKIYQDYFVKLKDDYECSDHNKADEVLLEEARKTMHLIKKAVKGDIQAQHELLPVLSVTKH